VKAEKGSIVLKRSGDNQGKGQAEIRKLDMWDVYGIFLIVAVALALCVMYINGML
jgi:hypothetical protein